MNKALLSSKRLDWCTPRDFFDALDVEFHFTLDAAATEKSAKCAKYYTPETDGLSASWIASADEGDITFSIFLRISLL